MTRTPELEALGPEWDALWDRCPQATPFQSPGWLLPWWHNLFGGGKLWTLAVRDAGRLVALAPFFIYGYPGTRRLVLIGSGITDYLDVLVEPPFQQSALAAIFKHLAGNRGEWDECDFQELRSGSPLLAAHPEGLEVREESCGVCPVVDLPESWEALEARIPSHLRKMRRARSRLDRAGEPHIEAAASDNLADLLDGLFALHAARWRERNEPGVLDTAALQRHNREVAAEFLARGWLRLLGLRLDGELAAVFYGFAARGRFYAYLDGFDPHWADYSPGTVLVCAAVEQAIREGSREFDFLRHREDFKYRWGACDRLNRRLLLRHSGADRLHAA